MADFPKVEPQSTGHLLRDLKSVIAIAKKDLEASRTLLAHVNEMQKQCAYYEQEIDGARARIFLLMVTQLRHLEATHADAYIADLDEALADLTAVPKGP